MLFSLPRSSLPSQCRRGRCHAAIVLSSSCGHLERPPVTGLSASNRGSAAQRVACLFRAKRKATRQQERKDRQCCPPTQLGLGANFTIVATGRVLSERRWGGLGTAWHGVAALAAAYSVHSL